jgi:hypothetical protein
MSPSKLIRQPPRKVAFSPTLMNQVDTLGAVGLKCRLELRLAIDARKETTPVSFVVDSGASFSTISISFVQLRKNPVPSPEVEVEIPLLTAIGSMRIRVRPGRMRAWWSDALEGYPFDWPVLFRADASIEVASILGLGGVVKVCRWTFDGRYSPMHRSGISCSKISDN